MKIFNWLLLDIKKSELSQMNCFDLDKNITTNYKFFMIFFYLNFYYYYLNNHYCPLLSSINTNSFECFLQTVLLLLIVY